MKVDGYRNEQSRLGSIQRSITTKAEWI